MLLLLLLAGGKPVGIQADAQMDEAVWIAEATILEATDRIRVRITSDPERIFRGFSYLGKTVELSPPGWGPESCRADLAAERGSVLVVASKNGTIPMIGRLIDGSYRLSSWCDYNAWWIYCTDKSFGRSVKNDGEFMSTIEVTAAEMAKRYPGESGSFLTKRDAFLNGAAPELTADELAALIVRLGDDDPVERDAAMGTLTARARWCIADLRKAAETTRDPEVRQRLRLVLTDLSEYAAAYDAAMESRRRADARVP